MFKKRKVIALFLAIIMIMAILSGCGGQLSSSDNNSGVTVNNTYNENGEFLTLSGESIKYNDERLSLFPEAGIGVVLPERWLERAGDMTFVGVNKGFCVGFVPPSWVAGIEHMTEDEIENFDFMSLYSNQQKFMKFFYVPQGKSKEAIEKERSDYQSLEEIVSFNGNTYYLAYNSTISEKVGLKTEQSDIALYDKLISTIDELKKGLVIFPIQISDEEAVWDELLQSLSARDTKGNTVTSRIFNKYDLTMINIWATWCGPCIEELPDLGELNKELPQNINMITICADGQEEKNTVNTILKECKAEILTICGDENLRNGLLANVYSYPTTIFVDKNGRCIGDPFVGAWTKQEYLQEIERRMEVSKQIQ